MVAFGFVDGAGFQQAVNGGAHSGELRSHNSRVGRVTGLDKDVRIDRQALMIRVMKGHSLVFALTLAFALTPNIASDIA